MAELGSEQKPSKDIGQKYVFYSRPTKWESSILSVCLPFNKMEKRSFRDLSGLLNTVLRWIIGQ
jgi:hypothetical protein